MQHERHSRALNISERSACNPYAQLRFGSLTLAVLFLSWLLVACGAPSHPSIEAEDVWARPALATMGSSGQSMASTGAAFMLLKNKGQESDRLIGGQTAVAEVVEIHQTVIEGDVMKMQMLVDGLEIPAQGQVQLKPGGFHIMLVGMKRDLKVGDTFSLQLQFEKSGTVTVEPEVREP